MTKDFQVRQSDKSEKTQLSKKSFQLQTTLCMWTSHREQDCSCVKKPRGRPPYQANKQLVSKANRTAFPEIHPELPQLRDISYNINVEIADEIEVNMLFDRSLPSTRCFLDISPERAPLKPVSQWIWTPRSQIWIPPPNFPFKHRLYHI